MLFLVRSKSAEEIFSLAEREGVSPELFDVKSVTQSQVKEMLRQCLFGVYLMEDKDPRLGVKTVEYLRCGLPIIASENIKGAADLVSKHFLGTTWDHTDEGVKRICEYCESMKDSYEEARDFNVKFSKLHFSSDVIAEKIIAGGFSSFSRES